MPSAGGSIARENPFHRKYLNIGFRGSIQASNGSPEKYVPFFFLLNSYLSNISYEPRPVLKPQFIAKNDKEKIDGLLEFDFENRI